MSYRNYKEYLQHPKFRAVVAQVFNRAGGRCENEIDTGAYDGMVRCCNKATEPHHIKYCKWGEFDTQDNLIAVCHQCHCELHTCKGCGGVLKSDSIKADRDVCFDCYMEVND